MTNIQTKVTTDDGSIITLYEDGSMLLSRAEEGVEPVDITRSERERIAELTPVQGTEVTTGE